MKKETRDREGTRASRRKVYSYLRFSSPEQALGNSEQRQIDDAREFARDEGLEFDESLKDEGVSAFRGRHRKHGALGSFLARVKAGEVPRGSILVVEALDRLSREAPTTSVLQLIEGLVNHEITIQTLFPRREYTRANLDRGDLGDFVRHLEGAHAESAKKSRRLQASWTAKRLDARKGKPGTSTAPAWLQPVRNPLTNELERFEIRQGAKQTIRAVFELRAKGLGKTSICKKLNAGGYWLPPTKKRNQQTSLLRETYILKLWRNREVLGEFQPHRFAETEVTVDGHTETVRKRVPDGEPIPDFYPRIIDAGLFDRVQELIAPNLGPSRGGRLGSARNLFPHLAKCAYCGGPLSFCDKGDKKHPNSRFYLICEQGRRGGPCKAHSINHDEMRDTVLSNLRRLRPDVILPNEDDQATRCAELRDRIAQAEAEDRALAEQVTNLVEQISRTKSAAMRDAYEEQAQQKGAKRTELQSRIACNREMLRREERNRQSVQKWQAGLADLMKAIDGDTPAAAEHRLRLRAHLRDLIERVEVFAVGFSRAFDPEKDPSNVDRRRLQLSGERVPPPLSDDIAVRLWTMADETPSGARDTKQMRAFVTNVLSRRMSKAGRFLRVHFKTGGSIDLVPAGSLADGWELVSTNDNGRQERQPVNPPIERLWRDFVTRSIRARRRNI